VTRKFPPSLSRQPNKRRGVAISELKEFVTMVAKLQGVSPDEIMQANADDVARACLEQDDIEDATKSFEAARRGDRKALSLRIKYNVATPQERDLADQILERTFRARRGRPPTMGNRHLRIAVTIEAFRGAGLSMRTAIVKAAQAWCLSEDTVTDLYKKHKLPDAQMKIVRNYFAKDTAEQIREYIEQFRSSERSAR